MSLEEITYLKEYPWSLRVTQDYPHLHYISRRICRDNNIEGGAAQAHLIATVIIITELSKWSSTQEMDIQGLKYSVEYLKSQNVPTASTMVPLKYRE